MDRPSRIFFPLRTSVELFDDPDSPAAITRAKQAAVLYDELVFEVGLYNVSVTPEGSQAWTTPPTELTPERLQGSRHRPKPGARFSVMVGPEDGYEAFTVFDAPLTAAYTAEFHTGILTDLEQLQPEWVKTVALPNSFPSSRSLGRTIRSLNSRDRSDNDLLPDLKDSNRFLRQFVFESFNRDSVIAANLGASFNVTSLFTPLLERRGVRYEQSGSESLRLFTRNLGALPWEAILEFREHPGSQEARLKLREFEERATSEGPQDAYAFFVRVSQEVTDALLAAWENLRPSLPEDLAQEVAATGVSFIPVVGPLLGPGLSLNQSIYEAFKDRRSWLAALMVLRRNQ